ncbi:MAG: TonB-dependent receptor [Bacteroidaceae bacterium]|nr:TonB-dependent receptor [Bacteroidaceae bacterium]
MNRIVHLIILGVMLATATAQAAVRETARTKTSIEGEGSTAADSLRTTDIEEIVVAATPKEGQRMRQQALASSSLAQREMFSRGVLGIKDISSLVPNVFIPNYGSHLTTAVFVRGVGSRTGTPAVALYLDGAPQLTSASYDFNLAGIDRIDVLRGPQGTLYGRGSMGGVIRVFTKNPFHYQGTEIDFDASHAARSLSPSEGGRGRGRLALTHYHRVSDRFAFSAHLFGEMDGGFFRNAGRDNELIDDQKDAGVRMRFVVKPSSTLDLNITASHEWLKQGGYPYEYKGAVGTPTTPEPRTQVGEIAYDNRSGYRRNLTNAGITVDKRWQRVELTSVSGFQHLHDKMNLDQDFTTTNLYTLIQRQNANSLSEELILKSRLSAEREKENWRYDWLAGASLFQSWMDTQGPVTFHADGLAWLNDLVNRQGNVHLPTITSHDAAGNEEYTMNFVFNNLIAGQELGFPGTYKTPTTNAALFHQSTLTNLLGVEGLTLTAGLRAELEHFNLDYNTSYAFTQRYGLGGRLTYPDGRVRDGMALVPTMDYEVRDGLNGSLSKNYLQLLPKFSLLYSFNERKSSNVYATVSRGHRSGGYNIQMFSDLLQTRMQTAIMKNVANATVPVVDAVTMIPADVKQTVREMLIGMGTQKPMDVQAQTWYEPETAWNYELGTHLTLWNARLQADAALFWMETRNQQLSLMSAGGLGRVTVNSGKSRSIGGEVSLRAQLTDGLSAYASYGYTHAKFRNEGDEGKTFVPFVPRHTLAAGATQRWTLRHSWLDAVSLHADYHAAGRIYWTVGNTAWQNFAGDLNLSLGLHKKDTELLFYAHNILSERYQTFYFETMQRAFAQYSRPTEIGVRLHCAF